MAKMRSIIHHWVQTPDHHLSVHHYCLLSAVRVTFVGNPHPPNIWHTCTNELETISIMLWQRTGNSHIYCIHEGWQDQLRSVIFPKFILYNSECFINDEGWVTANIMTLWQTCNTRQILLPASDFLYDKHFMLRDTIKTALFILLNIGRFKNAPE